MVKRDREKDGYRGKQQNEKREREREREKEQY